MLRPMLASLADAPLDDPAARLRAEIRRHPRDRRGRAERGRSRLWSRLGNEKTAQFPEIAEALRKWSRRLQAPVVLDGEIVALDDKGEPTGFQHLQGRIHLPAEVAGDVGQPRASRSGVHRLRLLREGATDYRDRPLLERRAALERLFARTGSPILRISEMVRGDGRALYKRALASGWEGLIAKHADSRYKSGKRTPDWRKLKIVHEQEFVVGGWTEPRQTRARISARCCSASTSRGKPRA